MRKITISKEHRHLVRSRTLKFRFPLHMAAGNLGGQASQKSVLDLIKKPTFHSGIVKPICVFETNLVFERKQVVMRLLSGSHPRFYLFIQNPMVLNLKQ